MTPPATLLDVNVLIALLWPAHDHHAAAHRWFAARGAAPWATCPLTEMAFVRIVSNPAFSKDALSPEHAWELLSANLRHPAHEFWPDTLPLQDVIDPVKDRLRGHQQLTDLYLLTLASHRPGGKFASFDSSAAQFAFEGAAQFAASGLKSALEVIPVKGPDHVN